LGAFVVLAVAFRRARDVYIKMLEDTARVSNFLAHYAANSTQGLKEPPSKEEIEKITKAREEAWARLQQRQEEEEEKRAASRDGPLFMLSS
jgi:hypothetical protein